MIKFYGYNKCSTCLKAKKMFKELGKDFKDIDITENPPTKSELSNALKSGDYTIKDLFNKSGMAYREMNMKDKIPHMSDKELITLLASVGRLVKRPFVCEGKKVTVGFKEDVFREVWA